MQRRPGAVLQRICSHFGVETGVGIALRTTHAGEADYQRTLVIEEWRRRGSVPPEVNRNNLYRYMRQIVPQAEQNDIHRCVRMTYTLTEEHKREIRSVLTPEMMALKRHYGVDVSRWGFAR
jgi:hypothetical protein